MPSLLKAADLASAHIIRGRLDAEGHRVDVVHDNICNLWGGAVVGGPVLVASAAEFPEIEDCVATVEEVEPPAEAFECDLSPASPPTPGIAGSALIGTALVGIAIILQALVTNLGSILGELGSASHYHSVPIPFSFPHLGLSICTLILGAAAGAAIHGAVLALRDPVVRIVIAAFVFLPFSYLPALAIAAVLILIEWILKSCLRQTHLR